MTASFAFIVYKLETSFVEFFFCKDAAANVGGLTVEREFIGFLFFASTGEFSLRCVQVPSLISTLALIYGKHRTARKTGEHPDCWWCWWCLW